MPPLRSHKRRRVACQHFPDDQTLRLQAGAGEDDVIHLPNGLDRVDCERQEEEKKCSPRLVTGEAQNDLVGHFLLEFNFVQHNALHTWPPLQKLAFKAFVTVVCTQSSQVLGKVGVC